MSGTVEITQGGGANVSIAQVDTGTTITLQEVITTPTITVAVPGSITGPQGPIGPQGVQGPVGPRGPQGEAGYTYSQEAPQATWTVNHDLDRFPSVSVVDSTGQMVEGDVFYSSANQVILTFAGAFSGTAYLN